MLIEGVVDGPVSSARSISPNPFASSLDTSNPSVVGDTLEFHDREESCLFSNLTDRGEVSTPASASVFGLRPSFSSVVNPVLEELLGNAHVDGPEDSVRLVNDEWSAALTNCNSYSATSHVVPFSVVA